MNETERDEEQMESFSRNQRCVTLLEACVLMWTRRTLKGRASRSEFWWVQVALGIVALVMESIVVLLVVNGMSTVGIVFMIGVWLLFVVISIPAYALFVRRLHDTGKSGWWWCIGFLPLIGELVLFVFMCQKSEPRTNAYGSVPNLTTE
ncbi:MAG: DUF805 domain-containing protein [Kiritimatiellia bacterium]